MHLSNLRAGVADAVPVVLGYVPIGLALGVISASAGFSPVEMAAMSAIVYAGSAQFIGVGMIAAGAPAASIVATTFFVNSRHFLMSAALYPRTKDIKAGWLAPLSFGLTDETFAILTARASGRTLSEGYILGLFSTSYLSWVSSTLAGNLAGKVLGQVSPPGLDFALPAMFIGLLVLQVKESRQLLVAILAGALSLLLARWAGPSYSVVLAASIAAAAGVVVRR